MTEEINKFLQKRTPLYIDDRARIKVINGKTSNSPLIDTLQEAGYSWIGTTRGYFMDNFVMLYVNDFQVPNCNVILIQAIFAYFPTIEWVGLGCLVGTPGEIWKPRLKIYKTAPIYIYE